MCFNHLNHPFSFHLADKLSLAFTVLFLLSVIYFSLCFYSLICKYLSKKSTYFSERTFAKPPGFWYKTIQLLLRSVIRPVVFCFFHYQYRSQMVLLSCIEVLVIICTIELQLSSRVFRSKLMCSFSLTYSLIFIMLNTALFI